MNKKALDLAKKERQQIEKSIVVKHAKSKGSINIESIDIHESSIFSANVGSQDGNDSSRMAHNFFSRG